MDLSQILLIVLVVLAVGVVYLLVKRLLPRFKRSKARAEAKQITEVKSKERKLLAKLERDKKNIDKGLKRLKKGSKKK